MSIDLNNGYRIRTNNPPALIAALEGALGPIRDTLDAQLYASHIAALIDRRDQQGHTFTRTLHEDAMAAFDRDTLKRPTRHRLAPPALLRPRLRARPHQ